MTLTTGTGVVVAKAAAAAATSELVKKISGECFKVVLGKYDKINLDRHTIKFIEYCEKVLFFRALASPDNDIYIDDVYVPIDIKGVSDVSLVVNDNVTLNMSKKPILLRGLAGQGKSTLLRKLVVNNMISQRDKLPIFYELKNYKGGGIITNISTYFGRFGIKMSVSAYDKILRSHNVKLFLDAFDEVSPHLRDELIDDIDILINKYNCQVICTSRPGTQIDNLTGLDVYDVKELNKKQISEIIYKNSNDVEKAKQLCIALERTPLHKGSESILRTPILVVLYTISYNYGEDIPDTLSQFYENIFDTVFFRHDNIKNKVVRERTWNDNRRIYREIFDCFCYLTQKEGAISFNRSVMTFNIGKSIEYVNEDSHLSDKISDELCSITNLIIEDGFNKYKFVHRSIQEFFTSSFICSLPYDSKCD
ncbi:MAG: NACHT domain-containing protein [Flavobacteriales bacterium]|nr:NACHT domain-containing protein [Flavobacteriales bacterium]